MKLGLLILSMVMVILASSFVFALSCRCTLIPARLTDWEVDSDAECGRLCGLWCSEQGQDHEDGCLCQETHSFNPEKVCVCGCTGGNICEIAFPPPVDQCTDACDDYTPYPYPEKNGGCFDGQICCTAEDCRIVGVKDAYSCADNNCEKSHPGQHYSCVVDTDLNSCSCDPPKTPEFTTIGIGIASLIVGFVGGFMGAKKKKQ